MKSVSAANGKPLRADVGNATPALSSAPYATVVAIGARYRWAGPG